MSEEVIIKKEKFYYTVKLNRPEKHNAFHPPMINELRDFFISAGRDKFASAIVLTGAGASFCAGGDLEWMKSMKDFSLQENMNDARALFEMFEAARNCPLPILSYMQGNVYGGGLGMAAISDVGIAEVNTKFCFSEVRIGLVPAVISSFVLYKMSPSRARELMLTARVFDAPMALNSGLIEFVGRELEAKDYLNDTLLRIGQNGPESVKGVKTLLNRITHLNEDGIKNECIKVIAERRVSDEGQEGIKSFLEKRKPAWVWGTPGEE